MQFFFGRKFCGFFRRKLYGFFSGENFTVFFRKEILLFIYFHFLFVYFFSLFETNFVESLLNFAIHFFLDFHGNRIDVKVNEQRKKCDSFILLKHTLIKYNNKYTLIFFFQIHLSRHSHTIFGIFNSVHIFFE